MKLVKVHKDALLKELSNNRSTHKAQYELAFTRFSTIATEALEHALLEAKTGRGIKLQFDLPVPEDHTAVYDRNIKMVQMSVDETLELTEAEFTTLVMDDWGWKQSVTLTNTYYGVHG